MNHKNFILGVMTLIIGIIFNYSSMGYEIGNASRMGPGMFPFMLSVLLIVNGALITIRSIKWKF